MKNIRKQNGITLIALVITIIVLLILAGVAISMLSGENGILKRAVDAKTQTENKSEEEQVKLAATEAMMATTDYTVKYKELIDALDGQLGEETYTISPEEDAEEWEIIVAKTQNHYTVTGNGTAKNLVWWYTGENKEQITNGKQTLTLGDKVEYDPTAGLTVDANGVYKEYKSESTKNGNSDQEFKLTNNEGQKLEWRVLGTDEDGNVLIMPKECIKNYSTLEAQYFILEGQKGAQYGADEVNNIASIYGYGNGAKSARSINEKDIAKIFTLLNTNEKHFYGNKVTYKLNVNGKVESNYSSSVMKESEKTSFTYLNGNKWVTLEKGQYVTLTSTFNFYEIEESHILYNLFEEENKYFWIGTPVLRTPNGLASYGLMSYEGGGFVEYYDLYASDDKTDSYSCGIRPTVSLKPDITFSGSSETGWTINS